MAENVRVGVAVLIQSPTKEPGKILLVEEALGDEELQKKAGMMTIVTGHVDPNENILDSAKREAIEESGIKNVELTGVLGVYQIQNAVGIVFIGKTQDDIDFKAIKSSEITSAGWYEPKQVLEGDYVLRPPMKQILEDYLLGRSYPIDLVKTVF